MSSCIDTKKEKKKKTVTQNACKLCTPLGACLAFKGIRGAIPFLHGSQGCATYIRRYMISHFREPVDIASSNFSEHTTIFGGEMDIYQGLDNVRRQYEPELIGVATTCLSETIGEDLGMLLRQYAKLHSEELLPELIHVNTPSYNGTHITGFHDAVRAVVGALTLEQAQRDQVNLFPGMMSPADLRYLKDTLNDFGLSAVMLPDYSDTLDGPSWADYRRIPEGGTTVEAIRSMGGSRASMQFGRTLAYSDNAGKLLNERFAIPNTILGWPVGVRETDAFMNAVSNLAGRDAPERYRKERGRLIDAYVDAHKYCFGKRVAVYGEPDMVIGLTSFFREIGLKPVLCATGTEKRHMARSLREALPELDDECIVLEGADFADIEEAVTTRRAELLVGNSKGYKIARALNIPLVRVGFPIHDRIGAQRIRMLGYDGTQMLFDHVVNALLKTRQDESTVGYTYL